MKTTRRGFIQQSATLAASSAAPWLANLAAISEASAQVANTGDYKALVCIFLLGGNDYANTLIPMDDASYATYLAQRPRLYHHKKSLAMGDQTPPRLMPTQAALPANTKAPKAPDDLILNAEDPTQAFKYALSPALTDLYDIYKTENKLAVLLNVGPLIEPSIFVEGQGLRKYKNTSIAASLPPRLGSHNDQIQTWQSFDPEGSTKGWGGRIGDLLDSVNTRKAFTDISVSGNSVLLTGDRTVPYQVTTQRSLSVKLEALRAPFLGSTAVSNALGQIITGSGTVNSTSHIFEQDLTAIVKRSIAADDVMRNLPRLESSKDATYSDLDAMIEGPPGTDTNELAAQLRTVAHLIRNQRNTGARRQVFYVTLASFDNHSALIDNHPVLLRKVGQAMAAFHSTLKKIEVNGGNASDRVTTFTASDFGRTLNNNDDGTDHGWGGHHFIMGGAVKGGKIYGRPPVLGNLAKSTRTIDGRTVNVFEDTGRGSLVPTTSVDQYAATLAEWMGVTPELMPFVVKNIINFDKVDPLKPTEWPRNLGFMKA
jgi:uncharacterized protein (DUF1501 family)